MRFKKPLCFLMTAVFLFLACSCSTGSQKYIPPTQLSSERNGLIDIYDINNKLITTVESRAWYTYPLKNGFIYTRYAAGESEDVEYYRYNIKTNENIKIGTIKNLVEEMGYDSVLYNNHLYMLVAAGDQTDADSAIYDIDLSKNTLTKFADVVKGNYANSMAFFENKVYVSVLDGDEKGIYEFDIETKEKRQFVDFSGYDVDKIKGDLSYHVAAYKDNLYVLRHHLESIKDITVYIDIYSKDLQLVSSVDITGAIEENIPEGLDVFNEHRQTVRHFYVKNGYVYYENFSATRALINIKDNNAVQTFGKDIIEMKLHSATCTQQDYPYIVPLVLVENKFYVIDTKNGEITEYEIHGIDEDYHITFATVNSNSDCIFYLQKKSGSYLDVNMHYVNLKDLKKK